MTFVAPAGPAPSARLPFLQARLAQALITRPTRRNPWFVQIPSIGVNARLMVLGYPTNSYLPVPPLSAASRVGWYSFSSIPGQPGNTVLVGHVDTYIGPAVFYNLYLLRPGNTIYIRLGATRYARYTVRSIRELPKSQFPATNVFGTTRARRLWLITCGGPFDYTTRHYLDNIVVSASQ
jgi:sortase (surface protein transpeptidase)